MAYANHALGKENLVISGLINFGREGVIEVYDTLKEKYFTDVGNKLIFREIIKLFENDKEITKGAISESMKDSGVTSVSFPDVSCDSIDLLRPSSFVIRNFHIIEKSKSILTQNVSDLEKITPDCSLGEIFAATENSLFELVKQYSGKEGAPPELVRENIDDLLRDFIENPGQNQGLPTPWNNFNDSIGGGLRTGVHLIGARSGKGKTVIGLNCSTHFAAAGIPVLYLDTEMEYKNVMPRMLASLSGVEIGEIESGSFGKSDKRKNMVNDAAARMKDMPLFYKTVAGLPFDEILSIIRRWAWTNVGFGKDGKSKQCVVVYDYFKMMDVSELNDMQEYQALGFQISKLTDFCKHYDIPCLSFVQLNRDGIDKESSATISGSDRLLWLCNSFSIFKEQNQDEVFSKIEEGITNPGNRKIITIKSRYGGEHEFGKYCAMDMKKEIGLIEEIDE